MPNSVEILSSELRRLSSDVRQLRRDVDKIMDADRIADAVADAMKQRGAVIPVTWLGRMLGVIVSFCSIAGVVLAIINTVN